MRLFLMENHHHILIDTPLGNLSQFIHPINGADTIYCNVKLPALKDGESLLQECFAGGERPGQNGKQKHEGGATK